MNLGSLARRAPKESPQFMADVADSKALVEQLVREIRTTSYLLHPPLLDETGLAGALRWYIDGTKERSGIDIQLIVPQDLDRLSPDMEMVIFRLCTRMSHQHSSSFRREIRNRPPLSRCRRNFSGSERQRQGNSIRHAFRDSSAFLRWRRNQRHARTRPPLRWPAGNRFKRKRNNDLRKIPAHTQLCFSRRR